jgi:hypothetical protein
LLNKMRTLVHSLNWFSSVIDLRLTRIICTMRSLRLNAGVIFFLALGISYSQTSTLPNEQILDLGDGWYKTTAWVLLHDDMTMGNAREKATAKALKNIVEYYCGVEVSNTSLSIVAETNLQLGMDHFSQITNIMSRGIILKKEILEARHTPYNNESIYIVTLKAEAGKLEGKRDPFFEIEASLNRNQYQNGDEMIININSTKNCYIFVFNILSDENVIALLPNEYLKNNFIRRGTTLRLPPSDGVITKFRVGLPEGKASVSEMIMVIGIKAEDDIVEKNFDMQIGNYNLALTEIMEFIMKFPRHQIEQINLPYTIQQ